MMRCGMIEKPISMVYIILLKTQKIGRIAAVALPCDNKHCDHDGQQYGYPGSDINEHAEHCQFTHPQQTLDASHGYPLSSQPASKALFKTEIATPQPGQAVAKTLCCATGSMRAHNSDLLLLRNLPYLRQGLQGVFLLS